MMYVYTICRCNIDLYWSTSSVVCVCFASLNFL